MATALADEYVSVAEAARLVRVHVATIRRWIEAGTLPAYRLGPRRVLVKRADLEGLITPARSVPTTGPRWSQEDPQTLGPLTPEEQHQALAAMEAARRLAAEIRARHGGRLFSSSDVLLNDARDQRTRDLQ
jgi:excisionase family DNA binding protein